MTQEPRSVNLIQSPCRQTPGYVSKYAACSRDPSGSFQNITGIDGVGSVMTSSPTSPTTASPCSSKASTLQPSRRQGISPACTGSNGTPPTNAAHTSVPPDSDESITSPPTSS